MRSEGGVIREGGEEEVDVLLAPAARVRRQCFEPVLPCAHPSILDTGRQSRGHTRTWEDTHLVPISPRLQNCLPVPLLPLPRRPLHLPMASPSASTSDRLPASPSVVPEDPESSEEEESESDGEPIVLLLDGREKRHNAGNRMRALLDEEEGVGEVEEMFKDEEGDGEFETKGESQSRVELRLLCLRWGMKDGGDVHARAVELSATLDELGSSVASRGDSSRVWEEVMVWRVSRLPLAARVPQAIFRGRGLPVMASQCEGAPFQETRF